MRCVIAQLILTPRCITICSVWLIITILKLIQNLCRSSGCTTSLGGNITIRKGVYHIGWTTGVARCSEVYKPQRCCQVEEYIKRDPRVLGCYWFEFTSRSVNLNHAVDPGQWLMRIHNTHLHSNQPLTVITQDKHDLQYKPFYLHPYTSHLSSSVSQLRCTTARTDGTQYLFDCLVCA